MANDLSGIGRGRIDGGYQGPIVLPRSTQAFSSAAIQPQESGALVPVRRGVTVRAPDPVEVVRPAARLEIVDPVIDPGPAEQPGSSVLSEGSRYVVVDGRRYDLDAPRGTYYDFLV